ncbi:MAG: sigma-54-dependent Fis family transcriptional regulator [Myxococcales bacterium]|nr:sigma-54-dependent Fis family transcriptional regulator [Myxococcales bacterium]
MPDSWGTLPRVRAAPLQWPDLLELHVVKRLGQIVRRRFGAEPGFARASGERIAGPEGSDRCARLAAEAARGATRAVHFACHDGRVELSAPILVDGRFEGCVYGSAPPASDLGLLTELIDLCAEEVVAYQGQISPRERRGEGLPAARYDYQAIIGRSRPVQELYRILDKVIESDSTVLIEGENGTGKELVARAIHFNSVRRAERFVVQNCSAFNDNLLDSELFGHKKGSFTGAVADKPGLFDVADRGSFFLDEIGDMSATLQVKVLRVLQEGTFTPVGDTATRRVDVRIIAASNRDLKQMVERGQFREDLFYRVNVISITCPPLRERRDDIPILIDHFLQKNARGRRMKQKKLARACMDRMLGYAWPGNIRELENEVERLVVLTGEDRLIAEELLSPRIRQAAPEGEERALSLNATVDALERKTIHEALKKNDWNKTRTAVDLHISRRNLIRKVSKYQLDQRRERGR